MFINSISIIIRCDDGMKTKLLTLIITVFLVSLTLSGCFENEDASSKKKIAITSSVDEFGFTLQELPEGYCLTSDYFTSDTGDEKILEEYQVQFQNNETDTDSNYTSISLTVTKYLNTKELENNFDFIIQYYIGLSKTFDLNLSEIEFDETNIGEKFALYNASNDNETKMFSGKLLWFSIENVLVFISVMSNEEKIDISTITNYASLIKKKINESL